MAKKESAKRKFPIDFFKKDPDREHVLYKYGGKQPVDVTKSNPYGPASYFPDYDKVSELYRRGKKKPYIEIHNHPTGPGDIILDEGERKEVGIWDSFSKIVPVRSTLPSFGDLFTFLRDDSIGSIAVYQHNRKTNETEGMYVIRKTKQTPKSGIQYSKYAKGSKNPHEAQTKLAKADEKLHDTFHYHSRIAKLLYEFNEKTRGFQSNEERQESLNELAKQLHLQIKYIPAKGFSYVTGVGFLNEEDKTKAQKKKLEQIVSGVVGIFGLLSSFFLLGSSVTGNAIGNLGKSSGSWLGLVFFLVGIAGVFWYFRSKKR